MNDLNPIQRETLCHIYHCPSGMTGTKNDGLHMATLKALQSRGYVKILDNENWYSDVYIDTVVVTEKGNDAVTAWARQTGNGPELLKEMLRF